MLPQRCSVVVSFVLPDLTGFGRGGKKLEAKVLKASKGLLAWSRHPLPCALAGKVGLRLLLEHFKITTRAALLVGFCLTTSPSS